MTDVIAELRPYLEAAYFLAGIALAVGLLITRAQLRAFQTDLTIRTERAAKEKAIEACSRYMQSFDVLIDAFNVAARPFELPVVPVVFDSFSHKDLSSSFKSAEQAMTAADVSPLAALNEMQTIASYFTTGVADEQSGFEIIGLSFCHSVEQIYGHIVVLRHGHEGDYWQPIVDLYRVWSPRLNRSQIERVKKAADAQLEAIGPAKRIPPIGGIS